MAMQLSSRQKKSAFIVMAGIAVLLALRLLASGLADRAHGPAAISSWTSDKGETQVWVFMDAHFYQLDEAGSVTASYPLASLGLRDGITDFQVISDNEILIGDPDSHQVLRCELTTRRCQPLWPSQSVALTGLFKFYLDVARRVLFVADNGAHQLYVYPLGAKAARAVTLSGELRYPNDVWADRLQTLWVADTNHHRIVGLRPDGKLTKPVYKLKAEGDGMPREHVWPVAFAMDKNAHIWGLFADGLLRNAGLVVFNGEHQLQKRITLESPADAVGIAALKDHVVIADRDAVMLHKININSYEVSPFGAADTQAVLRAVYKKQRLYEWLSRGCLFLMLLLLLLAFWLARQVSREESDERKAYLAKHGVRVN